MLVSRFHLLAFFLVFLAPGLRGEAPAAWTDEQFPSYIKRLNYFGERPDWSHDGKKILFISRSFGEAMELEVATGKITPLTHHYYHGGYLRAYYLSNGDILLLGPKKFDPENWRDARFKNMQLWVLDKKLDKPPVPLGEFLWEGPAVSRTSMKIAWAGYGDANDFRQLMLADLDYSSGQPKIINKRVILDNSREEIKGCHLEPQAFFPGDETKLTIQVGAWKLPGQRGAKVFILDLATGAFSNHSRSPLIYEEPEGIFPDGRHTLVESARHIPDDPEATRNARNIELYKLSLDDNRTWERLTYFNVARQFKASNGVVSDDGRFIAFMVARCEEVAGIGHGIYIMDLNAYAAAKAEHAP